MRFGGAQARRRPSRTRSGPVHRRADRTSRGGGASTSNVGPQNRVTRGSRLRRAPRVVLRTRARTELRSRRSFFSRRQLLDRYAAIGERCPTGRLPAVRCCRGRSGSAARPHRPRSSRAPAPWSAVGEFAGEHAHASGASISMPAMRGHRRRRPSPGACPSPLRCGRDRVGALRLRQAWLNRGGGREPDRILGTRSGRMEDASPLARGDR